MNMDANDIIKALQNQRDSSLNECAQLYATLQAALREVTALKEKYEPKPELKAVEK